METGAAEPSAWTDYAEIAAYIVPAIMAIASAINAATKHYTTHKSIARAILAFLERASFATSKDTRETKGKAFKAPMRSIPPEPIDIFEAERDMYLRQEVEKIRRMKGAK